VADDLSIPREAERLPAPAAEAPAIRAPRPEVYGMRFGLAYGVLAILLGAAVGVTIVVAGRDNGPPPVVWSDWQPSSTAFTPQAKEIAEHVGRQYRLPSGGQIVGVVGGQLTAQNIPVDLIAVRTGPTEGDDVELIAARGSVMFVLCGLGKKCAIEEGAPSAERLLLLRREALELTLYALKYMDDVERVFTFFPPAPGKDPSLAMFLRKEDVTRHLKEPLLRTLVPMPSVTVETFPRDEVELVDALTNSRLFSFGFQQAPSGNAVIMILDPAL
jgi:hypothetical protein